MSTPPPARPFGGPWTLRRRLVVGTTAVVGVVLLLVSVLGITTMRGTLLDIVDAKVTGSMSGLQAMTEKYRDMKDEGKLGRRSADWVDEDVPAGSPFAKPLTEFIGQPAGNLIAVFDADGLVDSAHFTDFDAEALSPAAAAELETVVQRGNASPTVTMPGLGSYALLITQNSHGETLVSGVSLASTDAALAQQTATFAIVGVVALVLTVGGIALLVGLALRPLRRVAATAVGAAEARLDRGEVALPGRVPGPDTDPRTEVGLVGEALNDLLDHVAEAIAIREATDRRMRRFVTDASHELRTPLAAIRGYAELTRQENAELPDLVEHALSRIESEATRMSSLVEELLLLARLDERQDLQLADIDLSALVSDAMSDARVADAERQWALDIPEGCLTVRGDRERLYQVVSNLLSNASTHTPAGTLVIARLHADPDAGQVVLEIVDDGSGVPDELLPMIFERFARGDDSRSRRAGSTGLGLAIVDSIVDAHGGEISVSSSSGGTTFRVVLPSASRADDEASAPAPEPEPEASDEQPVGTR